ncbi:hypothetical protein [Dokdonella sp.]|uniref:hypothetical protein n=1 Tax=Dokdonella sp. TaxID=2291710 RepID=UPI00352880A0
MDLQCLLQWWRGVGAGTAGCARLATVRETGWRSLFLVVVFSLLVLLNAFGVKLGARAITVLATLKLTPLFLLATLGSLFVDWTQVS